MARRQYRPKSYFVARFRMYLGVFRPGEYVFGDYYALPRHVDSQEKILSRNIVCNSVLNVPGSLRPLEPVFEDYFGVPRHAYAQEIISS